MSPPQLRRTNQLKATDFNTENWEKADASASCKDILITLSYISRHLARLFALFFPWSKSDLPGVHLAQGIKAENVPNPHLFIVPMNGKEWEVIPAIPEVDEAVSSVDARYCAPEPDSQRADRCRAFVLTPELDLEMPNRY